MAVSTDKLIPDVLPPKDEQEGIDFIHILDAFDPSALSDKVLNAFASRDPYVTAYGSETGYYYYEGVTEEVPDIPAESRLNTGRSVMRFDREELQKQTAAYEAGQAGAYKKCRAALIKAIGSKTCAYIVEQELKSLTPAQQEKQAVSYARWEQYLKEERERIVSNELDHPWYDPLPASRSEKVAAVRKGIRKSDGRLFTQRDFARLIEYPVNKYAAAEKDDDMVEDALLEKLIMVCHANPYYLYDDECEAYLGEYSGDTVDAGDAPAIIVDLDVILKWIQEGKPRATDWTDGVTDKQRRNWY